MTKSTSKASKRPKLKHRNGATIKDHEATLRDHDRLVRQLDIAMSGKEGAAKQASLCDLVGWADEMARRGLLPFPDIRNEPHVIAGTVALNVLRSATPYREVTMVDIAMCITWMANQIAGKGQ